MGDRRRFDLFAKMIMREFPAARRIADVAGGRGWIQVALRELGHPAAVVTMDSK